MLQRHKNNSRALNRNNNRPNKHDPGMTFEIKQYQRQLNTWLCSNPPNHKWHSLEENPALKEHSTGDTAHFIEKRVFFTIFNGIAATESEIISLSAHVFDTEDPG